MTLHAVKFGFPLIQPSAFPFIEFLFQKYEPLIARRQATIFTDAQITLSCVKPQNIECD